MKNVALVVHDFDRNNGQGRYCVEVVRRLRARCHFTVYANTADPACLEGVNWCRVPAWRWRHLGVVFSFLGTAEWMLRGRSFDLVHAQGLSAWHADVVTVHMIHSARLRRLAPTRFRDRLFSRIVSPVERAFYRQRRLRHAIVMARSLGAELTREYGWQRPTTVIPHGTDAETFRPPKDGRERADMRARFGLPPERQVWLFMGEAAKGLRQVIEQLPEFPAAHLLVVTRSDVTGHRIRAGVLGVAGRITFHGFEPRPEFAFRAADAFVYPSAYDPFGMVASEAMASGLPVVLGRAMGVAELVTHGVDGLLCDPDNRSELGAQIARIAQDSASAARLGKAARATIQRFSWEACAEATWEVYRHLLETPRLS